jgi:hypothetical protein
MMPFRVAGASANIFFGFSVLREVRGEGPVPEGFQGRRRAEKWQSFSVTLRKVSRVTKAFAFWGKLLSAENAQKQPEFAGNRLAKKSISGSKKGEAQNNISTKRFYLRSLGALCRTLRLKAFRG